MDWPVSERDSKRRQQIGQNGNDGAVYEKIAPHENQEYRLVMSGYKPLGTIEKAKDPIGFATAVSLGAASSLVVMFTNTEEGAAEVAFVKPGNIHLLHLYMWLLKEGVKRLGLKEYHREMGRLYGYSEEAIETFIKLDIHCECSKCKGS